MYDFVVVGAGFAGSVIAERVASVLGCRVLVIDRREHIGGNAYDHVDGAGLLVHRYGPHIFHTNSPAVFDYLSAFTAWRPYEHRVLARVRGQLLPIPINRDTINRLYGLSLTEDELEQWFAARAEGRAVVETSEDVVVSRVGRELYELFFRGYTRKQWGLDPSQLDASVAARVAARTNSDDRYFTDRFQAMPRHGYTAMFERMLDHPKIEVRTGVQFGDIRGRIRYRTLIYTGPVDEFFGRRFGPLPYRSLHFRFETLDRGRFQPTGTVNEPDERVPFTRITEFKHLTGQSSPRTTIVYEYPRAEGDPYYPIPRPQNALLYAKYRVLADAAPDVKFVGRLATYRYYNMDQVVAQALATFKRIAGEMGPVAEPLGAPPEAAVRRAAALVVGDGF
jgi:UDP-galactopyranose mutase